MAIIKFGVIISGLRGTLGGTIFSANKAGPFCRPWNNTTNPRTAPQQVDRAYMSAHASEWEDLTQAQRDDWDTYAAAAAQELTNSLGETYYASGFNWYCRINQHLLLAGRSRRDTYPTVAAPAAPTVNTCYCYTPISVDFHVRITYPSNEFTGLDVIVKVALLPRTAPIWTTSGFRLVCAKPQQFTTYTEFGLTVEGYFGDPPSAGKCFFAVQRQTTQGRRSAVTTKTADVITL